MIRAGAAPMLRVPVVLVLFALLAVADLAGAEPPRAQPPARPVAAAPTNYHPVAPTRILDTRPAYSHPNLGYYAPWDGGTPHPVKVAGPGYPAPSGISAVVMNVTITNPSSASFLTIYPTGGSPPNSSFLNWGPGFVTSNLVQVEVGADGTVQVLNQNGFVDLIMDVEGYFATPAAGDLSGRFNPEAPVRILDTRPAYGPVGPRGTPLGPGEQYDVKLWGVPNVPPDGAAGVVLNLTVTTTTSESFMTVWPKGLPRPTASNLNWFTGQTKPNRVIVPLSSDGWISIYNSLGTADVIIDVNGWFSDGVTRSSGQLMSAIAPTRILDTRPQFGPIGPYNRPFAKGESRVVTAAGAGGLPTMSSSTPPTAVVLNVTVTGTSEGSYLAAYPSGSSVPNVSDLNWAPGWTIPNLVVVKLAADGSIRFYNSVGCTDLVIDLVGWYVGDPVLSAPAPSAPSTQATCVLPPPPPPPPPPRAPRPIRLRIPSIGVWADAEQVGTDGSGNINPPSNIWHVGWYDGVARPGEGGDAIMDGHVDWWNSATAVFTDLPYVPLGAYLYVDREDGSTVTFKVDSKSYWPYYSPPNWLYESTGGPQLSLVTCAGAWDGNMYTQRLIVHSGIV